MPPGKACSHLAADGQYREICEELVAKYPNLRHRDFKHARLTSSVSVRTGSGFRFVSIDFSSGASRFGTVVASLAEAQRFLRSPPQATPSRCLYVVEGQNPGLFALLGHELKVDPQVFMRHQRTALYDSEQEGGNTPCLASLVNPDSSYTLETYEARHFPGGIQGSSLVPAGSLRHIALPTKNGRFDDIGVICNKASFWGRPMAKDGWQGSYTSSAFLLAMTTNFTSSDDHRGPATGHILATEHERSHRPDDTKCTVSGRVCGFYPLLRPRCNESETGATTDIDLR